MHTKSILIADDHEIVRVGVKTLIGEHLPLRVIDEAATETEVIQLVKANFYHLILLDISMPGSDL